MDFKFNLSDHSTPASVYHQFAHELNFQLNHTVLFMFHLMNIFWNEIFSSSKYDLICFSEWSPEAVASTSGVVPPQPAPPTLESASVTSLTLGWNKRPTDETFTLQMEDALNDYGFRPVYFGPETRFECQGLRRNADYKFRVSIVYKWKVSDTLLHRF